jgi:hypothetical protein
VAPGSDVRGRSRTGLVADGGFGISFDESGVRAVIHVGSPPEGERVELPQECEWIADDGVMA